MNTSKCGIFLVGFSTKSKVYVSSSIDVEYAVATFRSKSCQIYNADIGQALMSSPSEFVITHILEYCGKDELRERKAFWIKLLHSDNPSLGYNKKLEKGHPVGCQSETSCKRPKVVKRVHCVETNTDFPNVTAAGNYFGVSGGAIRLACLRVY